MTIFEEQVTNKTGDMVLEGVRYDVTVDGLMATCRLAQHYVNPTEENLETVFTFPIAGDATLLEVEVRINDRTHKGTIKEKGEAQRDYEEAIDEGDRALLLEKNSEGHYTLSVANILPGDTVTVTIEYAQLLAWRQDRVRLAIPTTFTPKYGDPADLGLDAVTDPAFSFFAENRMHFTMCVKGVLTDSRIEVPSHEVTVTKEGDETLVRLKSEDLMDKDLVVTFTTDKAKEARSFTLLGRDLEGYAAIASFFPTFTTPKKREPKTVLFVVDCSGSMWGISIQKAKSALAKALDLLHENDKFNIIIFGTHYTTFFNTPVYADNDHIHIAKRMIRIVDSNMGGTEMAAALRAGYKQLRRVADSKKYVFLITDGAIYNENELIEQANKFGVNHFAVGVGKACNEVILQKLAEKTNGSYVSVNPNEEMDHYILELFKKIEIPKTEEIVIEWPIEPKWQKHPDVVFDGDTFYTYALFGEKPIGEAVLYYLLENGERHKENVVFTNISTEKAPLTISRIVMDRMIRNLEAHNKNIFKDRQRESYKTKIVELSMKYQLFSSCTSYILVDEVEEEKRPGELPKTIRVANMLPQYRSIPKDAVFCIRAPEDETHSKEITLHYLKMSFKNGDFKFPPPWILNLSPENIISPYDEDEKFEQLIYIQDWIESLEWWVYEYERLPKTIEELQEAEIWEHVKDWLDTNDIETSLKAFLWIIAKYDLLHSEILQELIGYEVSTETF